MNDATVISVDYRITSDIPFLLPKDAYTVIEYVAAHAERLGADASKIIVAGDSAGGNLSACAAHYFKQHPKVK